MALLSSLMGASVLVLKQMSASLLDYCSSSYGGNYTERQQTKILQLTTPKYGFIAIFGTLLYPRVDVV